MQTPNLKDLVKNNRVRFSHYRKGYMYYLVGYEDQSWQFPVPLDDVEDATLLQEDKAMLFMRYIRKAINSQELVPAR
jgi:hypothetical protein